MNGPRGVQRYTRAATEGKANPVGAFLTVVKRWKNEARGKQEIEK